MQIAMSRQMRNVESLKLDVQLILIRLRYILLDFQFYFLYFIQKCVINK